MNRQQKHEAWMQEYYRNHPDHNIGDLRSALADAAGLCDAMVEDILDSVKPRTKLKLQRADEVAGAVKKAADAIWAMRDRIKPNATKGPGDTK